MGKATRISNFSALADERYTERNYWEAALSGGDLQAPSVLPVGAPGGSGIVEHLLSQESYHDLMRISSGSQERLHVLLYSVLLVLLRKYTSHSDLLIGSPIYNQGNAEGDYINRMLCLRTPLSGEDSFQSLASKCGKTIHEALHHQNYPYELIARFLNPSRGANLDLKTFFTVALSIDGLHLSGAAENLHVELHFHFSATSDGLLLNLNYDSGKFGASFVQELTNKYDALLQTLLADTSLQLSKVGLWSQTESPVNYGAKAAYPHERLDDWLEQSISQGGDSIAISMGDNTMTYTQLGEKSLRVANHLIAQGLEPGDMVGLRLGRSIEALVALVGTIRAGGVFVPIDNDIPTPRLLHIVGAANPHFLIVNNVDPGCPVAQLTLAELMDLPHSSAKSLSVDERCNTLCYTLFTSGTTGQAKGCMISHKSLVNYIHYVSEAYFSQLTTSACLGWFTTLSFDFTLTGIFGALTSGGQVRVYDQEAVESTLSDLFSPQSSVNMVKLTPSHISILNMLQLSETNVKVVICGGEELTTQNIRTFNRFPSTIKVFNEYGPTEATVGCIVAKVTEEEGSIPIGKPILNTGASIIDIDGQCLPEGMVGQIVLTGDNLMEGYLNDLAGEHFMTPAGAPTDQRFYKTGDLGYRLDGDYYYLGRLDEEFKLRGYRIHPNEVTAAINEFEGVTSSYVMKVADDQGDVLVGYLAGDKALDISAVKAYLQARLPQYMVPGHLFVVDRFPLKPSGKIDVKSLPSFESWKGSGAHYTEARNEVEQRLVNMWEEVLRREQVGVFDNFFMIGGHSLHATRVITRIKRDFIESIDFRALYKYPNISDLAVQLKKLMDEEHNGQLEKTLDLTAVPDRPHYPLSYAQRRLWVMDQLDSTGAGYISSGFYRVDGPLGPTALTKALHQLVDRHEILRTRFVKIDGEPRQEVLTREEIGFAVISQDYTAEESSLAILEQSLYVPFKLEVGPAIRVILATEDELSSYLGISFHHIVCDGWSMSIILAELRALYLANLNGSTSELPSLSVQYRDYAVWEELLLQKESVKLRKFWTSHLKAYEGAKELPMDYPRPDKRSFRGGIVTAELGIEALESLSDKYGVNVYAIMMSSVKILVYYLTEKRDITIGTAVSGRDQVSLEDQVGLYVNTLPVRSVVDPDLTLKEFIKSEYERLLDVLSQQRYPFDRILDDLNYKTLPNRNPLFDVGFTFNPEDQGQSQNQLTLGSNTTISSLEKSAFTVKSDLWFHAFRSKEILTIETEFNIDLFKKARVQRYTDLLLHVLNHSDWSIKISHLVGQLAEIESVKRKATLKSLAHKNLRRLTQ